MTLKTLMLAGASITLLGACAAPNEYRTYEVNKEPSSYTAEEETKSWIFWGGSEEEKEMMEKQIEEETNEPVDITL